MPINGKKIRELRISKGLSQFGLALEIDVSRSTIDLIEHEKDYPCLHRKNGVRFETVEKLATFFGVAIDELVDKSVLVEH